MISVVVGFSDINEGGVTRSDVADERFDKAFCIN
jgi:hypothetical protein